MKKVVPYILLLFPVFFICYGIPYPEESFRQSFFLNFSNIHSLVLCSLYGALLAFHPAFVPFRNNLAFTPFGGSPLNFYFYELGTLLRHPITVVFHVMICLAALVLFRSVLGMGSALLYCFALTMKCIYYFVILLILKFWIGRHKFNQSFAGALQVLVLYHMIVSSVLSERLAPFFYFSPVDAFFLLPFRSYPSVNPIWFVVPLGFSALLQLTLIKRNRVWL
jgi:hypothetical protein